MKARLIACAAAFAFVNAFAQIQPIPMSGDNRLITFPYNANENYTILTIIGASTHLMFEPDEVIEAVAVGNSITWLAEKLKNNLFIKPTQANDSTAATVLTNKRNYQLTFRSSPANGKWFQRVSWSYPNTQLLMTSVLPEKPPVSPNTVVPAEMIAGTFASPESLNWGYEILGDAPFKPVTVFDDGRFIYLRYPPNTQEMPAIFSPGDDGVAGLVNYIVKGDLIVVQKLAPRLLLKLGKVEIGVSRLQPSGGSSNRGFANWFKFGK